MFKLLFFKITRFKLIKGMELTSRVTQLSNLSCRFGHQYNSLLYCFNSLNLKFIQHLLILFYVYFLSNKIRIVKFELIII